MKTSRKTGRWLVFTGALLLAPQAVASFAFGPTIDAVALVTAPVVRIPLESLRRSGLASIRFRVPNGEPWARLRRSWGDHAYVVFAASPEESGRSLLAFGSLGLELQVRDGSGHLFVGPAPHPPYAYSSETTDFGRLFGAEPGAELQVDLRVTKPDRLPDGELRIEPFWPGAMKDRMVSAMIEHDLRRPIEICTATGMALLILGATVIGRRPA